MADAFKACSIDGCKGNAHYKAGGAKGWCRPHFRRWARNGEPLGGRKSEYKSGGECRADGCDAVSHTKGFCSKHYQRFRKFGDPNFVKIRRDWKSKICSVEGCGKDRHAHGLCVTHNSRRLVTGDPLVKSLHDWVGCRKKWVKDHALYSGDDCLKWPFTASDHGRGVVGMGGKTISAPRAMCILANGKPPTDKHEAAHSCGNGHKGCMNPNHLSWKTAKENNADMIGHGTIRRGEKVNTNILTEAQVIDIRSRLKSERPCDLARVFGVSPSCIGNIKSKKTWAWL